MADIPGHNSHAMNERGCRDKAIPIGARIWHMKGRTSLSHDRIDRENSPGE